MILVGFKVICDNKKKPTGHYAKWNQIVTDGQILYDLTYMRYQW